MPLVWVTGNSGVGKSTACVAVRMLGKRAIDADDDGYSRWVDRATGEAVVDSPDPVPQGWLDRFGWKIDRERVQKLSGEAGDDAVFLFGSVENESDVRDLFDTVICLVIDDDTLRERLAERTTNAFGQHPEELEAALKWNPGTAARYRRRRATIIDATRPLDEVVRDILASASGTEGPASR